jgi:hypothetical protein
MFSPANDIKRPEANRFQSSPQNYKETLMLEQLRTSTQLRQGPGSGGDFFDAPDNPNTVTVSSGPYGEDYPVAGMTVAQIRARLRDRLDIDPRSQAIVNGHDVGEEAVLESGQMLMFTTRASEKGNFHWLLA